MDWGMVSAISTGFMALVILITAVFAALQLKQVSKSRKAETFMELSNNPKGRVPRVYPWVNVAMAI